jgi:nucleotide-binding universal stress UspA family protein
MQPNTRTHAHPLTGGACVSRRAARRASFIPVQEPTRAPDHAVVAGYDGSPLARAAVAAAGRQAGGLGCVFVVYAYAMPPGFLGSPYFDRRLSEARETGASALAGLLAGDASLPPSEYIPELISGPPADALVRVANARKATAIVIGASRIGLVGTLHRGVVRTLLRTATVPVITIPRSALPAGDDTVDSFDRQTAARESRIPDVGRSW